MQTIVQNHPTVPYDISHLVRLVRTGKVDEAKAYIQKYFFRTFSGFVFVNVNRNIAYIENIKMTDISPYIPAKIRSYGPDGKMAFDAKGWFLDELYTRFNLEFKPNLPAAFIENNTHVVNMFRAPIHSDEYKVTNNEVLKNNVDIVLQHIREVICANNESLYDYFMHWLANLVYFRKNKTIMYFQARKGTGKSIFTEFIQEHVMQPHLTVISSDPTILTNWTVALKGKMMIVLEELPCSSKQNWSAFNQSLKSYATGNVVQIKEKFKNDIFIDNMLSFMIISNENALRFSTDQRRIVSVEMSEHRRGDTEYFNRLAGAMNAEHTGTAFFHYLRDTYPLEKIDKFVFTNLPESKKDSELRVINLPYRLQFIKDTYLVHGLGIKNRPLKEVYNTFVQKHKHTNLGMIKFNQELCADGFVKNPSPVKGNKCWDMSYEQLFDLYTKNGWLHEDDGIFKDGSQKEANKELPSAEILYDQNAQLKKEIERLKQQLAGLQ